MDVANTKVNIGPLISFEAHNLGEILVKQNIPHEIIKSIPKEVPQISFGGMEVNPSDRYLYVALEKSDYESHQDIFEEMGYGIFAPELDPVELRDVDKEQALPVKAARWSFRDTQIVIPLLAYFIFYSWGVSEGALPETYQKIALFLFCTLFINFRKIGEIILLLVFAIDIFDLPIPKVYILAACAISLILTLFNFWKDKKRTSRS